MVRPTVKIILVLKATNYSDVDYESIIDCVLAIILFFLDILLIIVGNTRTINNDS